MSKNKDLVKHPYEEGEKPKSLKEAKNITDDVRNDLTTLQEEGQLQFPSNYSVGNALKAAWLILQDVEDKNGDLALEVATKVSIYYSLYDMVIQGLNPQKDQCYFTVYGDELSLMRSYFGDVAVAKRFADVIDVNPNIIYKGDEIEFDVDPNTGKMKLIKHKPSFENIKRENILGAYAIVVTPEDRDNHLEVMTLDQIKQVWQQGKFTEKMNPIDGDGNIKKWKTHWKFMDQMCKKAVIARAVKMYIKTSDDSSLLAESYIRSTGKNYDFDDEDKVQKEIEEKANKKELKFEDDVEDVDDYKEMKAEEKVEGGKQTSMLDDDAKRGPDF